MSVVALKSGPVVTPQAIADLRNLADDLEAGSAVAFGIVRVKPGGDYQVRYAGLSSASEALAMIGALEHLKADIMENQRG